MRRPISTDLMVFILIIFLTFIDTGPKCSHVVCMHIHLRLHTPYLVFIDNGFVLYTHTAPVFSGRLLKLFAWILENRVIGPFALHYLKINNLIAKVKLGCAGKVTSWSNVSSLKHIKTAIKIVSFLCFDMVLNSSSSRLNTLNPQWAYPNSP